MEAIPYGAHIYSTRLGYTHHGIYVGSGKVIHHSGWSKAFEKGPIACESLKVFCDGNGYRVKRYDAPAFSPVEVVTRARLKLKGGTTKYNLIFSNCEHFATWCITGEESSEQVQRAAIGAAAVGVAGATYIYARRSVEEALSHGIARATAGSFAGAQAGVLAVGGVAVAGLSLPISAPLAIGGAIVGGFLSLLLDD